VPEEINTRVEAIQSRLKRGLSHRDVMAALESVRDLVMEAYLLANKTFAMYLKNVNQELADIYSVVGGAVEHHVNRIETAQQLQNSMIQQMTDLETEASDATDLKQLKSMVKSQIGNIRQALNHYHQTEMEQQQLSDQLQELAEKIKAMEAEAEKNHTTLEKHRYKSLHDPLTELPNREAYNERIQSEFNRWQRYQHSLSLAVCDLDFFKKINDSFGHQAGDRVLKVISRSIAKRLREVDFFCRYGGEEFVVILPETTLEKATTLLEKIRIAIAGTAFNYKNDPLSITLSIGITQFRQGDSIESAFGRADKALYAAKAEGRNRSKAD
jgi:diguanylate cyclase